MPKSRSVNSRRERNEERNQLISCQESKIINPTDLDNSFLPLRTLRPTVQKFSAASCSTFAPSVVSCEAVWHRSLFALDKTAHYYMVAYTKIRPTCSIACNF